MNLDNLAYPVESLIARLVVRKLLNAGYSIEVQNGEETVLKPCRGYWRILNAMATTDEDRLIVRKPKAQASFVTLYYGNGEGIIRDYGVLLEPLLDGANADAAYKAAREAMDRDRV